MFMEEVASLNLVKGDDDIFEENNVFFSERDSKTWDDTCEDV